MVQDVITLRHLSRTANDAEIDMMRRIRAVADVKALEEQRLSFEASRYGLLDIGDRISDEDWLAHAFSMISARSPEVEVAAPLAPM